MDNVPVIAIDGPSGTGKSTVSARVAQALQWHYLDSGALYRWVALQSLTTPSLIEDLDALRACLAAVTFSFKWQGMQACLCVNDQVCEDIRTPSVSEAASVVAKSAVVREALLPVQRQFARSPGLVTEGRDMATIVFPDAAFPIYLDADPHVRAKRRYNQLQAANERVSLDELLVAMQKRDARDESRDIAPLKRSERASVIDTSTMTLEQVVQSVTDIVMAT